MILELDGSNPRHRELKRLMLAVHSIGDAAGALRCAEPLDPTKQHALITHVLAAAVVAYARPFVGTRSAGRISQGWECFDDPSLAGMHERVIRLRAKLVAHSDDDMHHIRIVDRNVRVTITPVDGGESHSFIPSDFTPVILSRDSLAETMREPFLRLCEFQHARLESAASDLRNTLRPGMTSRGEDLFGAWPDRPALK